MSQFDNTPGTEKNVFIKSKPEMLNNFYGTSDVFPYWVADMDFQVAEPIRRELNRLVERGVYSYEFNEKGIFTAIANWYESRHQLTLSPDNFVQVPGVLSGIALLLRQFTGEGDAVLIHTPAYHQFSSVITKAHRRVIKSELLIENDQYQMDFENLERQIEEESVTAMIFCNPHNPTGRVWRKSEITQMMTIAERHNVLVISDEIHSDIVFKDSRFTSLTDFGYDNVIAMIGSPAKTFGMHSISNGYIYTNNRVFLNDIKQLISALYLDHGNAFTTFATIAAYERGGEWLDETLTYLQETVDWIIQFSAEHIPLLKVYRPEGTYQVWFDFSALGLSGEALQFVLSHRAKMGLTPGSWFDAESSQYMRMNIATSRSNIERSFEMLKDALAVHDQEAMPQSGCSDQSTSSGCC